MKAKIIKKSTHTRLSSIRLTFNLFGWLLHTINENVYIRAIFVDDYAHERRLDLHADSCMQKRYSCVFERPEKEPNPCDMK